MTTSIETDRTDCVNAKNQSKSKVKPSGVSRTEKSIRVLHVKDGTHSLDFYFQFVWQFSLCNVYRVVRYKMGEHDCLYREAQQSNVC